MESPRWAERVRQRSESKREEQRGLERKTGRLLISAMPMRFKKMPTKNHLFNRRVLLRDICEDELHHHTRNPKRPEKNSVKKMTNFYRRNKNKIQPMIFSYSFGSIYRGPMIWYWCIAFLFPIKIGIFSYFSWALNFCSTFFSRKKWNENSLFFVLFFLPFTLIFPCGLCRHKPRKVKLFCQIKIAQ